MNNRWNTEGKREEHRRTKKTHKEEEKTKKKGERRIRKRKIKSQTGSLNYTQKLLCTYPEMTREVHGAQVLLGALPVRP